VAIILLVVFGSLAAASLPLLLGFASVMITGAIIYLLSQEMEMSVFVTNMASMIGIGVAVDYSLSEFSTCADWLPGTSKPPPVRFSVCFEASGSATTTTASQAPTTTQRLRASTSARRSMNARMG
jgi:MMPL family